jgi:hypothetical protein
MATPWMLRLCTIGCCLTLVACEDDDEVAPGVTEAPDMTAVVMSYESPSGTLAGADLGCLAQEAVQRLGDESAQALKELIGDALRSLRQWLENSGLATGTLTAPDEDEPRVRGRAQVFHTCRGWDPAATTPDEATNGRIHLNALFDTYGLYRVVWGEASNCQGRVDLLRRSVNVFLNADLAIFLYRGLRSGGDTNFAVKITGQGGTETDRRPIDWDFRASSTSLETRLATAGGEIVASVKEGLIELRGRDGVMIVDPTRFTCSPTPDGGPAQPL